MILLDSSFIVSIEVETDQNHLRAVSLMKDIIRGKFGEIIITDYIFDETVTVTLVRTKDLKKAAFVGKSLRNSLRIIGIDKEIFEEAWKIFKGQKGTMFSFTDCTIIALMENRGIRNIATFDEDFRNIKEINVIQ